MVLKVHRAWKTRDNWRLETEDVVVAAGTVPSGGRGDQLERAVQIAFAIHAAGGGASRVVASVPSAHFLDLAREMMKVNAGAALRAFVARETGALMAILKGSAT